MKVLVVSAHPDDEILGAGATLARHVDQGDEVHACVLSEGAIRPPSLRVESYSGTFSVS